MEQEVKVGDTFRVFEVVKSKYFSELNGKHTIEVKDTFYKNKYGINTFTSIMGVPRLHFDIKSLKQTGTIRIKSLK